MTVNTRKKGGMNARKDVREEKWKDRVTGKGGVYGTKLEEAKE